MSKHQCDGSQDWQQLNGHPLGTVTKAGDGALRRGDVQVEVECAEVLVKLHDGRRPRYFGAGKDRKNLRGHKRTQPQLKTRTPRRVWSGTPAAPPAPPPPVPVVTGVRAWVEHTNQFLRALPGRSRPGWPTCRC